MRPLRSPLPLVAALMLLGCGGDDGGSSPTPAPTNQPPSFTSAATASVSETQTGTIYTATASDPDGNALTFTISGGADASAFAITAGGALSFRTQPDFEAPGDADRNNVYQVTLGVSDGSATASLALSVTVTDSATGAFRVRRVATSFAQPLYVLGIPDGSGRVFVLEKGGRIRILNPATGAINASAFLDVSGSILTDGERGLLGMALAPDFAQSGTFYVYVTNTGGDNEVRRYRLTAGNRDLADPTTLDVILRVPHPGFSNHNGGWIDFGRDGQLYIGSGDGGGSGDPGNNAQNTNSLLGKILRIDPSSDAFPGDPVRDYAIPTGNPFAGGGGAPEVWHYGLRNPFRASFDRVTGNLWIGDVGQGAIEEIDFAPAATGGLNYGWNRREGSQPFNGGANSPGFTPPVTEYSHGGGALQGRSVTGGYVYRGPVEALQGLYIFGDFVSGNLWSVPIAQLVQGQTLPSTSFTIRRQDFTPNAGTIGNVASFGQDQAGNLYIVDFDGEVFAIEPA